MRVTAAPITRSFSSGRGASSDSVLVHVTPCVGAAVWLLIAAFHCVCGTFLALVGALYLYLRATALAQLDNVELYGIAVNRRHFPTVAAIYIAIASVHMYELAFMVLCSIAHRKLVFSTSHCHSTSAVRSAKSFASSRHKTQGPTTNRQILAATSPASIPWRILAGTVRLVVWVWRSFAVTNPNYGVVYIMRELIQTLLQTYQAYRLSYLLARPWMNHVFVALLVGSCCTTPIVRFSAARSGRVHRAARGALFALRSRLRPRDEEVHQGIVVNTRTFGS